MHPVTAAKLIATIDHISNGRAAINVVAGWFAREFELFGLEVADHADRYRYAVEWIEVVKRLWAEDEKFDFDGEFFQIKGAISEPKPLQRPHPMVMNAGFSEASRQFTSKHADMIFIPLTLGKDPTAEVELIKQHGRERGREIQVWATTHITCRDTEKEARDLVRHYADDNGDWETAAEFVAEAVAQSQAARDQMKTVGFRENEIVRTMVQSAGLHPIVGTPEQIVEHMKEISDLDIDGITMSFYNYEDGLERYERQLLPLMREAGLRIDEDVRPTAPRAAAAVS
jgi:FMNH2-dependent dimethyl sulfone monooxygenase